LTKFKSHRFHHVRAHTGGGDDLSVNNDVVDRMARGVLDDTVRKVLPPVVDDIFAGCPLRIMGPPIPQALVMRWIRDNLDALDRETVDKHLFKAFVEICKARDVVVTKQKLQRQIVLRAETGRLQVEHGVVDKCM
jgi:hypothetical protein